MGGIFQPTAEILMCLHRTNWCCTATIHLLTDLFSLKILSSHFSNKVGNQSAGRWKGQSILNSTHHKATLISSWQLHHGFLVLGTRHESKARTLPLPIESVKVCGQSGRFTFAKEPIHIFYIFWPNILIVTYNCGQFQSGTTWRETKLTQEI